MKVCGFCALVLDEIYCYLVMNTLINQNIQEGRSVDTSSSVDTEGDQQIQEEI